MKLESKPVGHLVQGQEKGSTSRLCLGVVKSCFFVTGGSNSRQGSDLPDSGLPTLSGFGGRQ